MKLICTGDIEKEVGKLDLSGYKNLLILSASGRYLQEPLTDFVGDDCSSLIIVGLSYNNLTNCDFFKSLPCPEKLQSINLLNNNIQSTDIAVFSRFLKLTDLHIGTSKDVLKGNWFEFGLEKFYDSTFNYFSDKKRNCFYGSLESLKNLNK